MVKNGSAMSQHNPNPIFLPDINQKKQRNNVNYEELMDRLPEVNIHINKNNGSNKDKIKYRNKAITIPGRKKLD